MLVNLTSERLSLIKELVGGKNDIFWISADEDDFVAMNPEKGLITGLARTARAENENLNFVTLDVQEATESHLPALLRIIKNIVLASFGTTSAVSGLVETEYVYRDGSLLIPRLVSDTKIRSSVARVSGRRSAGMIDYCNRQRPLKLRSRNTRSVEDYVFEDDESLSSDIASSEVEIAIKAHVLSRESLVNFSSQEKSSPPGFYKFAGIVKAVGLEASKKFQVGDRVCAWHHSEASYPSYIQVNITNVYQLPNHISLAAGAVFPVAYMTACYCLVELARLQKGQAILVHDALSDTGRSVVTLAKYIGADVFVTTTNSTERADLLNDLDIPSSHILSDKTIDQRELVSQLTQDNAFDINFDSSNNNLSDSASESWALLAPFGVYIRVRQPGTSVHATKIPLLQLNATLTSFDFGALRGRQLRKAALLMKDIMPLFQDGTLVVNTQVKTMSIADINKAFRRSRTQKENETLVLESDENTRVMVSDNIEIVSRLDSNATYVVVGGLGDLGQRVYRLMAKRGAKHIVLISRRILGYDERQRIQDEVSCLSPGIKIYGFSCDISNSLEVRKVISEFDRMSLPPVKGIVQSAGVLQVS